MKVGVIGVGVVGGATLQAFKDRGLEAIGYDRFKPEYNDTGNAIVDADVIFVCVPTPTLPSGAQDYSAIEDVLEMLVYGKNYQGVIVIKSTVVPGTTARLGDKFNIMPRLIHNPEFLTAANPYRDFLNQQAILLGGGEAEPRLAVRQAYEQAGFHGVMEFPDSKTTEFAKYLHNTFLAVKVSFMNEFYGHCEYAGVDFTTVKNAAALMGGIGTGHSQVPGPDGQLGFGGMCFVKDTEALREWVQSQDKQAPVLEAAIKLNRELRPTAYDGTESTGYQD